MNVQFVEVSGHNLESSPYTMFTLPTMQFQTTFAQGWGQGEKNPFIEVIVNSKEENS